MPSLWRTCSRLPRSWTRLGEQRRGASLRCALFHVLRLRSKSAQTQRKIARLEARKAANITSVRRLTISKLKRGTAWRLLRHTRALTLTWSCQRAELNNVEQDIWKRTEGLAGASGAFSKRIRRWVGHFSAEVLEFYLLNFPKDAWKQLSDIVHFHAEDFKLPYFLAVVHGKPAPPGTLLSRMDELSPKNVLTLLNEFPQMVQYYSFIRRRLQEHPSVKQGAEPMNNDVKLWLCKHVPMEDLLWQYDEFACPGGDKVIAERLRKEVLQARVGNEARTSFGKLVERLMYFK